MNEAMNVTVDMMRPYPMEVTKGSQVIRLSIEEVKELRTRLDESLGTSTNFGDVAAFHEKFDLPRGGRPRQLEPDLAAFRAKFLFEEAIEFVTGLAELNLAKQADALIDLVYVAMGTAVMMGLPWQELWDEVHYANMCKVRADGAKDPRSMRKHSADVVKPNDWIPPDIEKVLRETMR